MEFRQLKYFVTIAEEGHFGRAAQRLHVSQPALSQQIKLLEDEIGVALFDTHSRLRLRRVKLTAAGEALWQEGKRILQLTEKALAHTKEVGRQSKVVKLGIYKALLQERILEITTLFAAQFPQVELQFVEFENYVAVQEALENGSVDLGLTLLPIQPPSLSYKMLKIGNLSVLHHADKSLENSEDWLLHLLKEEKWIELSRHIHPVYEGIEGICRQLGVTRNVVQEVSSLNLLIGLVGLGKGVAFAPTLFDFKTAPNVVVKSLQGTPFQAIELCYVLAYHTANSPDLIQKFVGSL